MLLNLCTALRFLTILPISWKQEEDVHHFPTCLGFFSIVGLGIGACSALIGYLLLFIFPQNVVAFITICFLAYISGCLHLDGLADSWDGLLSARPRDTSLEIMKDSRVGAMGVIGLLLLLLGKYVALVSLNNVDFCKALFFMPFAGRVAILLTMARLPYAREEGGLGALFYSPSAKKAALLATAILLAFLFLFASEKIVVTLVALLLVQMLFGWWCKARLGGATGDTLGAVCELSELATAIAFTVLFTT